MKGIGLKHLKAGFLLVVLLVACGRTPSPENEQTLELQEVSAGQDVVATFVTTSDWNLGDGSRGFSATVTLTNTTASDVTPWTLGFDLPREITEIWDASYEQNGDSFVFTPAPHTSVIPVGGNVTFSFNGTYQGVATDPSNFTFNGQDISGGGSTGPAFDPADIEIRFSRSYEWQGGNEYGFTGLIELINNGQAMIDPWQLEFDFPHTITDHWDGTLTQAGDRFSMASAAWNSRIDAGETVSFGFNAVVQGSEADLVEPNNFVLNGVGLVSDSLPPAEGGDLKLIVDPSAVLMTTISQTKLLEVNVFNAIGDEVSSNGMTFDWSVSDTSQVELVDNQNGSATLSSLVDVGSASITVRERNDLASPFTVYVTIVELQPDVSLLNDNAIVFPPPRALIDAGISDYADYDFSSPDDAFIGGFSVDEVFELLDQQDNLLYPVVLRGYVPEVGGLVLASEGTAVGGRILSVETRGDFSLAQVTSVSLTEVFKSLRVSSESTDGGKLFVQSLVNTTLSLQQNQNPSLPLPITCKTDSGNTVRASDLLDFKLPGREDIKTPFNEILDLEVGEGYVRLKIYVEADFKFRLRAGLALSGNATLNVTCTLDSKLEFDIPVSPQVSAFLQPKINVGLAVELKGKIEGDVPLTPRVRWEANAPVTIDVIYDSRDGTSLERANIEYDLNIGEVDWDFLPTDGDLNNPQNSTLRLDASILGKPTVEVGVVPAGGIIGVAERVIRRLPLPQRVKQRIIQFVSQYVDQFIDIAEVNFGVGPELTWANAPYVVKLAPDKLTPTKAVAKITGTGRLKSDKLGDLVRLLNPSYSGPVATQPITKEFPAFRLYRKFLKDKIIIVPDININDETVVPVVPGQQIDLDVFARFDSQEGLFPQPNVQNDKTLPDYGVLWLNGNNGYEAFDGLRLDGFYDPIGFDGAFVVDEAFCNWLKERGTKGANNLYVGTFDVLGFNQMFGKDTASHVGTIKLACVDFRFTLAVNDTKLIEEGETLNDDLVIRRTIQLPAPTCNAPAPPPTELTCGNKVYTDQDELVCVDARVEVKGNELTLSQPGDTFAGIVNTTNIDDPIVASNDLPLSLSGPVLLGEGTHYIGGALTARKEGDTASVPPIVGNQSISFKIEIETETPPPPNCEEPPPPPSSPSGPGTGGTFGDPHLMTFDGEFMSIQSVGEFILSRSTVDDFEVQARFAEVDADLSANAAVAMNVAGDRVGIYTQSDETTIMVNGEVFGGSQLGFTLEQGGFLSKQSDMVIVQWPDGTFVEVTLMDQTASSIRDLVGSVDITLPETRFTQVEGLLGNFNEVYQDDYTTREGDILNLPSIEDVHRVFAESWRIDAAESLFDYGPGESTITFTDPQAPRAFLTLDSLTAQEQADAEVVCRDVGISNPSILAGCILDVGLTDNPAWAVLGLGLDPEVKGITMLPLAFAVEIGSTYDVSAVVSGPVTNKAVTWSVEAGSISGTGLQATYTPPTTPGDYTITATLVEDPDVSITGTITVREDLLVGDDTRIQLNWGALPDILDTHLYVPVLNPDTAELNYFHIYYPLAGNDYSEMLPFASLDRDDTNGFGPEIVTIHQRYTQGTYEYLVHNYSADVDNAQEATTFREAGATVSLLDERGVIRTVTPPEGEGFWWHVFSIDAATGEITDVNRLSDTTWSPPAPMYDSLSTQSLPMSRER